MSQKDTKVAYSQSVAREYREIKITEATPELLRPLLTYCRHNEWQQQYPASDDGEFLPRDKVFELFKEFPNKLCLVLQGRTVDSHTEIYAYLLSMSCPGGKQVYDAEHFLKGVCHEYTLLPDGIKIVPVIARLSEYVAAKRPFEVISSDFCDYLAETFPCLETDSESLLAPAIYLALCVHDWSAAIAKHGTLEDAMSGIRALLPEKLEHMGIGFYTARAAIETIAMLSMVYKATPQQLKYIFGQMLLY